jgi:hypothetical protein
MPRRHEISRPRVAIGAVVWGGLLLFVAFTVLSPEGAAHEPADKLVRYVTESPRRIELRFPPGTWLERGDPVFIRDPDRFLLRIGRVTEVERNGALTAAVSIYPEHANVLRADSRAESFVVRVSAAWVVETLLPPDRLRAIREEAALFFEREGGAVREALWPELKKALLDVIAMYEEEFPKALAVRSDRWKAIYERHREGVVKEELLPVLEEVVLPIAKARLEPFLTEVGRELWKELPIWSLGIRYVLERVPGSREDQVEEKFKEYLEAKAAPILEKHSPEALRLAGSILQDSLSDERVREALGKVAKELAADEELGDLLRETANELVLENERLARILEERWEAGLRAAVLDASRRLDPLVREVVNGIVLNERRDGINPRLAQVLRTAVFRKDGRWILLTPGTGAPLPDGAALAGSRYGE